MSIPVLSVENMRRSDRATILGAAGGYVAGAAAGGTAAGGVTAGAGEVAAGGVPGRELMWRAGKGVFEAVDWKGPVAVVCGSGNNAGDGYVIASLLCDAGIDCSVILCSPGKFSEDGRYYYEICVSKGIKVVPAVPDCSGASGASGALAVDFKMFGTVVDCIFGTGFRGKPEGVAAEVIEKINSSGAYVVSVDINSGLNGDSGLAQTAVKSDITVSVGSFKTGHFLNMAKDYIGRLVNIDIGIVPVDEPYSLFTEEDAAAAFPVRKNFSNKSTYGYVCLIGGSERYSGAIQLAYLANCAMRSGCGVVKVAAVRSICPIIASNVLESTIFPLSERDGKLVFDEYEIRELTSGAVKSVAFGMGIGVTDASAAMLSWLLSNFRGKLLIDADGLTCLARIGVEKLKSAVCKVILTPHLKEFSVLSGRRIDELLSSPVASAVSFAAQYGTVLLLKGSSTIVTDGKSVNIVSAGCPGMATAGSGDVLSGIIAALCGFNSDTLLAASAGAFVNGRAGEYAQKSVGAVSMIASDTIASVPAAISSLLSR